MGETADVTIHAPDLCFVRPPSQLALLPRRIDDLQAFHYGGDRGALSSVADSRCYSCPLTCRLELVAIHSGSTPRATATLYKGAKHDSH